MLAKNNPKSCNPEIWAGIECTINRVEDQFFDQLSYANYYAQPQNGLIADLGIQKVRFPILWEKHQPKADTPIDWSWTDAQLNEWRDRKVDVIAGLVHHGSGPAFTDLTDPEFPYLLADYARQVAARYPWLEYYTPINEPLTTARFSGLYGLWYPHAKSDKVFLTCLLNEIKGIVLSMQEIRKINPAAKLVQTEDLGKTYSTEKLKYQARFENERRWLTYDLLCGRVNEKHKLWKYFLRKNIPVEHLEFLQENFCVPDVFGFNHYVTSERYLDEDRNKYSKQTHGGNKRHRYADVEAVRVPLDEPSGLKLLLQEAWERYRQPIAITEVHLHCHREEQIRWFKYVWNTCEQAKASGVQITAVTAWAALGSFGWNQLLTKPQGLYEPGVFDISNGSPRKTALATYITELSSQSCADHFLASSNGWWERSSRFITQQISMKQASAAGSPLLIIGKRGTLGQAFAKGCRERDLKYHLLSRADCDISDKRSIENVIAKYKPWAIINAAGYVRVDDAEKDCDACFRDNHKGAANLASATKSAGIQLVSFSSDLVFDGEKQTPYMESDAVRPLNVYGESKARSERDVLKVNNNALIVRTSAFFGSWDQYNFNHWVETTLQNGMPVSVANDVTVSPTYVPDLVHATLDLLVDKENGIWHLANKGEVTWSDLAYEVAATNELDNSLIDPKPASEMGWAAARPRYSVLGSEKSGIMPSLENALSRYFEAKRKTGIFVS